MRIVSVYEKTNEQKFMTNLIPNRKRACTKDLLGFIPVVKRSKTIRRTIEFGVVGVIYSTYLDVLRQITRRNVSDRSKSQKFKLKGSIVIEVYVYYNQNFYVFI